MTRKRYLLSTRIDSVTASQRRALADALHLKLAELDETMMRNFISQQPWKRGNAFVVPAAFRLTGQPGWRDCKLELPAPLLKTAKATAKRLRVSAATFGYSGMLWWLARQQMPRPV